MDVNTLNQVLGNQLPNIKPFDADFQLDNADEIRIFNEQGLSIPIQSFMPDGSYFGIGIGPINGLEIVDKREDWHSFRLGTLIER